MSTPDDEIKEIAKQGGKKILDGIAKGGILFTKRIAEGITNATIAQSGIEDNIEKVKAAGTQMGKAVIKGTIDSSKAVPDIIDGVSDVADAISKKYKKEK